MDDEQQTAKEIEMAHAQALKYGEDLVRIYQQEKAKRLQLELINQRLNAVWTTAPNGLALLDEHSVVIQTNPRFETLVEQPGKCLGHDLGDIIPSPHLSDVLALGQPVPQVDVTLPAPTRRTLQITAAPLAAGNEKGWVVSLHDMTEHKRLEGLKEEFIDIAAHELRTPLAIILGFASVLAEDEMFQDEMATGPLDAIVTAANRLKVIVNELVEFAVTKHSNKPIGHIEQFSAWDILVQSISAISHDATQADVDVRLDGNQAGELLLSGDKVIIAQALGHILENAVRFNQPSGQVVISASQTETETTIRIEDTGMGIPNAELDRIFDMFYQVDEHMTRQRGGLGMGLSIAKRGIELHGGRISVTSTLKVGSCFTITLPNSVESFVETGPDRLDTAHRQTLVFGRDLARAVIAQRNLRRRLTAITQTGREIADRVRALENESGPPSAGFASTIADLRRLADSLTAQPQPTKGRDQG